MKRSNVRPPLTALWIVFAMALAACGGSDSPSDPGNGGTPPPGDPGDPGENEVHVADDFFDPSSLTVAPETTVTWTWVGTNQHNVVWTTTGPGLEDSGLQSSGSHEVTMPADPGEYTYHCTVHPGMTGSITVETGD